LKLAPLYPILDVEMATRHGHDLVACARAFAALGLETQQVRAKTLSGREFLAWAERLAGVVPQLIINDRADIARLVHAAGVHVGQFDLPVAEVRHLAPAAIPDRSWIVGVSTHNPAQITAAAATRPNYLAIGPIFPTASKTNPDPVVGLEAIVAARQAFDGPVVAIGGITAANCAAVWQAGADAIAVMAALWREPDPVSAARRLLASAHNS
jgi:thiamine-phosphate pyrophosphorylase